MNAGDNVDDIFQPGDDTPSTSVTAPARGTVGSPFVDAASRRRRRPTSAHVGGHRRDAPSRPSSLPQLVTVDEAAAFLCTSRCAIYAMLERGQLPRPIRIGRRVLLLQDELLDWLHQKRAPSLQE